ncbi:hypothetical protein N7451_006711 [Penicillium sp. IBT 35674x]|nr:hypothetical protein N7451_006711 [Penicillium sp. IBT 35674x]
MRLTLLALAGTILSAAADSPLRLLTHKSNDVNDPAMQALGLSSCHIKTTELIQASKARSITFPDDTPDTISLVTESPGKQ